MCKDNKKGVRGTAYGIREEAKGRVHGAWGKKWGGGEKENKKQAESVERRT